MPLFKGKYTRNSETNKLYTWASTKRIAHQNFCSQLAKKLSINPGKIRAEFSGDKNNYIITEVNKG